MTVGVAVGVAGAPQAASATNASIAASRIVMCFFQFMRVPLQSFGTTTALRRSAFGALLLVLIASFPSRILLQDLRRF
jgi:hypothetical protein